MAAAVSATLRYDATLPKFKGQIILNPALQITLGVEIENREWGGGCRLSNKYHSK